MCSAICDHYRSDIIMKRYYVGEMHWCGRVHNLDPPLKTMHNNGPFYYIHRKPRIAGKPNDLMGSPLLFFVRCGGMRRGRGTRRRHMCPTAALLNSAWTSLPTTHVSLTFINSGRPRDSACWCDDSIHVHVLANGSSHLRSTESMT
jgi:hypothetical protein